MLRDLTDYFTHTKKSFLQKIQERKAKITKVLSFILGCGLVIFACIFFLKWIFVTIEFSKNTVFWPPYGENSSIINKNIYTTITKYTFDKDYTTIYFHSVNPTDDTLRRVEYDTVGTHITTNAFFSPRLQLLETGGLNGEKVPEFFPGGKGSSVD